ncbi:hypothetical protein BXQ17_12820 [Polaribacter sp. BM10]|uniref:LamG-like jellyroll fold domain-containing protein n=1 Tax=Polaribacter sp. BM10 TaxID=1529069 RepID=UPI00098B62C2|nr:LamG-like jellyroll fold domain-containing protein [Polaribacter sp. BM10]AQS94908.1 hypothetical protein BXQ17_12820 [Polaribacter sp. BM10]
MIKKLTTTFLLLFSFIVFSQTATHLNFDGVDDYISVTMPSNIPIAASNYTIEAMVKPEELNGRGIVGWGNYGVINQVNAFRFEGSSGLRNYWWSNDALANFTFNLNTWYHVAVTYDGSTRKFYVDGVEIENIASSGINVPNANNFRIGSTNFGEYFKGGMDDVRIWNVARTASEISNNKDKELVGNETGLVAYYKFNQGTDNADNSSITSATDVTTNNNATLKNFALTGTTSNWVYDASRVLNTAPIFTSTHLNFDGVDDQINIPYNSSFDFSTGTVEAMLRLQPNSNNTSFASIRTGSGNNTRWSLHIHEGNNEVGIYNGSSYSQLSVNIEPNVWYHVAFVMTSSLTEVFVDGISIGTINIGINIGANSNIPFVIGNNNDSTYNNEFFIGDIDEVRVWDDARTATEISNNKDKKLLGTETNLIAYYQFNQGLDNQDNTNVDTLQDLTVNNFNGSLQNFALTGTTSNWAYDASRVLNTAPIFTSTPPTTVIENNTYNYTVTTSDAEGDDVFVSVTTLPSWLSFTNNSTVSTYAGNGNAAIVNGPLASSQFQFPRHMTIDNSGNMYIADSNIIRKISTLGEVTTFSSSGFNEITGIAVDASGNVFVSDEGNHNIKKITPSGTVSTFVGSNLSYPAGIAFDNLGYLYVVDRGNNMIKKVSPAGVVSAFAGSGTMGLQDGQGSLAQFSNPRGIALDAVGNIYVTDTDFNKIRMITSAGIVSTLPAKVSNPNSIALDSYNNLYITETSASNHKVIMINTIDEEVVDIAGGVAGYVEGSGFDARFSSIGGIAIDNSGTIFVSDISNYRIRSILLSNAYTLNGISTSSDVGNHNVVLKANDNNGGIATQNFTINVAEVSAPIISSLSPLDDGNDIAINTNLEITFSENIAKGTGNITIYDASDNSVVEAIDVTSGNVTISNTVVTINPTSDLAYDKSYYIHIAATAFKNSSDKNFVGIVDNTTWNFSTLQGLPTLTTTDATAIGENTVTFGGEITNEGLASPVTERGIVFSTYTLDTDPEIGEINTTKIIVGSGLGVFTDTQTSLESNRKYAYRAYAINSSGVSYGDLKTFITDAKTTDAFITRWQTSSANEAISFIQNSSVNIDCKVDWGDGSPVETFTSFPVSHTYTTAASYEVKITGNFPGFEIGNKTAFDEVDQWGNQIWISLANSFRDCTRISTFNAFNIILNTPNVPDLSAIIAGGLYGMFENTYFRDENIANWDVSNVTDFSGMFKGTLRFNQDISKWNMSNATNLNAMFENAVEFNQDLNAWDVKKVTTTTDIFKGAIAYNQSLENWVFDNQVNQISIDLAIPNISTANMDATLFGWYQYYVSENSSNIYPILFTLSGSYCKFTISEIFNLFAKGINLGGLPQDCTALDVNTFTGAVNSSWFEAGNWSKNSVPTETEDVDIPSGQTVDVDMSFFEVAKANNLYLNGTLNINSDGELLVKGFLKVFSSRIININNGKLLVEKFVDAVIGRPNLNFHKNLDTNWHLVSLPVIRSSIEHLVSNGNLATGTGGNLGFASYNNALKPATGWQYINASSTGELINGKGYIIKRASVGITSFYGELNTTAKTEMAITEGGVGVNTNSWNLIGNPYTYPISVSAFLSESTNNNISQLNASFAAVYKWDGSEYVIHNLGIGSEFIYLNPGESFFVNAKSGGGLITFTKPEPSSGRLGGGLGGPLKSTNNKIITQFSVKLNVSDGNQSASTEIKYLENATIGLDVGYDAGVFGGVSTNLDVYTHLVSNDNTNDFGIQCLPFNKIEEMVVPVGISLTSDTEITFSIKNVIMPEGVTVYLEDRLNSVFIPLEDNNTDYTIKVSKDADKIGRFFIHTTSKSLSVSNSLLNDVLIYKKDASTLTITGLNSGDATIKLYSILGKEVLKNSLKSKDIINIPLPKLSKGIYIIQLETLQGKLNKKIMIDSK